jgi:hypothetical protein
LILPLAIVSLPGLRFSFWPGENVSERPSNKKNHNARDNQDNQRFQFCFAYFRQSPDKFGVRPPLQLFEKGGISYRFRATYKPRREPLVGSEIISKSTHDEQSTENVASPAENVANPGKHDPPLPFSFERGRQITKPADADLADSMVDHYPVPQDGGMGLLRISQY